MTALRISEDDFMSQITKLAELYGYRWVHFRPAKTSKGWRTPVSGPLGKGWPDLFLARDRDQRRMFVELKARNQTLTVDQRAVLDYLRACGFDCHVWWPQDLDVANGVLA